jgi:hypothetical protein
VSLEIREMGSFAIGVTANRRVLGSLNDLASLACFEIRGQFVDRSGDTRGPAGGDAVLAARIRVPEYSLFGSPTACHFVIGPDRAAALQNSLLFERD